MNTRRSSEHAVSQGESQDARASAKIDSYRWSEGRMYAIAFDLDQKRLEKHYPGGCPRNAYGDICRVLTDLGFWRQQGSVYFSNNPNPVACILAIQELQKRHPWFRNVVNDVRMLRIEENNDLMPALGHPELPLDPPSPRQSKPAAEFKLN